MANTNQLNLGSKLVLLNGLPLTLPIASSDPGSAVAGDQYYNSTSNVVKYYNGSSWLALLGALTGAALSQYNVIVGNGSNLSAAVDSNSVGDILVDSTNGLTIKAGAIVNADVNASAAIAYSKLALAASIKASDINSEAATNGYVLTADGAGAAAWVANASGTVTSVALSAPVSVFSVSGSPVTTSGSLDLSFVNQSANQVFAGPASGGAAAPAFRALVADDIPDLSAVYESVNNFAVRTYQNSIALADSVSSPTTLASLTFAFASYGSMAMDYVIVEDTTLKRRQGTFRVATDGVDCGYSDDFAQSATLGNGIVLSATINGSDVEIQFTGTGAEACTMRAEIAKFVA